MAPANGEAVVVAHDGSSPGTVSSQESLQSRAYQMEMFEQSLKDNIIVCMETGSGKTQM